MHLVRRLVNERQQRVKRYAVLLQQGASQVVAVIDEVTGKDSTQVQVATVF